MNWIYLVFAVVAASLMVYWYFLWRTAQRWNMLLRRAGRTPDDDVLGKSFKLVGFILSGQHKAFEDRKLSLLVSRARVSFAAALGGVLLWAATVALAPWTVG